MLKEKEKRIEKLEKKLVSVLKLDHTQLTNEEREKRIDELIIKRLSGMPEDALEKLEKNIKEEIKKRKE